MHNSNPKRILLIIESPGKAQSFRKAMQSIGLPNHEVLPTFGRLFDLPKGRLGIRQDRTADWRPIRPDVVERLQQAAQQADEVWLATDADDEGDLIARHAQALCADAPCRRVLAGDMEASSLRAALAHPASNWSGGNSDAAEARRLADRLLSYGLSDGRSASVGRVSTPTLADIEKAPLSAEPVRVLKQRGNNPAWVASIDLKSFSEQPDVLLAAQQAPAPSVEVVRQERIPYPAGAMNSVDALQMLSDHLGEAPSSTASAMQSLYEKGRMSYPRSDESGVSAGAIQRLADQSRRLGMQSPSLDRTPDAVTGHGALVVLDIGQRGDPALSPQASLPDRIRALLFSRLYWGRVGCTLEITHGRVAEGQWGIDRPTTWRRFRLLQAIRKIRAPEALQAPIDEAALSRPESAGALLERALLRRLRKLGLGRPSSAVGHVAHLRRKFLDAEGGLRPHATASLQCAAALAPALLDPSKAVQATQRMANALGNPAVRMGAALDVLGCAEACEAVMRQSDSMGMGQ